MPRKKQENTMTEENTLTIEPAGSVECFELQPGFYFVDENRNLKTKTVIRGKPGEDRRLVTEPIFVNTLPKAKDAITLSGSPMAILCVTSPTLWPVI